MNQLFRSIIQRNKQYLTDRIDLNKIKPEIEAFAIFTRPMLHDIFDPSSAYNLYDELCTRGPSAFRIFIFILKKCDYCGEADALERGIDSHNFNLYYKMNSKPIGYCLIVINETFEGSTEKTRYGASIDGASLKYVFQNLGYEVGNIKWNLGADEIAASLEELSQNPNLNNVDSCVIIIATHGIRENNRDILLGADNRYFYVSDMYKLFNNRNCPALLHKPKLFFLQMCRGNKEDPGVPFAVYSSLVHDSARRRHTSEQSLPETNELRPITSVTESTSSMESTDVKDVTNDELLLENLSITDVPNQEGNYLPSGVVEGLRVDVYPSLTDTIVVHSTLPGHTSRRHHEYGSWFFQDLISVLTCYYDRLDLAQMLLLVAREMESRVSEIHTKQTIHVEHFGVTSSVHFGKR